MTRFFVLAALMSAGATVPAIAQSAPSLSNNTYVSSQKLQSARTEAVRTAGAAESREHAIAMHKAQLRHVEAQARAAAQPTMRINTGGPTPVSVVMPTGSGLVPGPAGETNYHVNVQVGEGNQSAITTTALQSEETITSDEEE